MALVPFKSKLFKDCISTSKLILLLHYLVMSLSLRYEVIQDGRCYYYWSRFKRAIYGFYLKQKGINAIILEARSRAGGRIYTVSAAPNSTPVEMGATWFADKHTWFMRLIEELDLSFVTQYQKGASVYELSPSEPPHLFTTPPGELPSYRMAGGSAVIIKRLMEEIGVHVSFHVQISRISEKKDYIEVTDANARIYTAKRVVVTIPPYLLLQSITFSPALPEQVIQVMQQTHTWMGNAIKFAFIYEQPFWRSNGHSGTVLSQSGIATEVYDHTNAAGAALP